jgi:hypothetical protein
MVLSQLSSSRLRLSSLALCALLVSPVAALSDSQTASAGKPRRWFDPQRYVERGTELVDGVRRLEIVEMLSALAQGQMPDDGKGWFHGGQSRYGWQWLAKRYDRDADGAIFSDEFPPDASDLLARLDRDENGKIEKEDLNWSSDAPYVKQMTQTRRLFSPMDRNRNGQITREEWRDFFDRIALDADSITPADLQPALFPPQPASSNDDPTPLDFLSGFVTGELGSISQGPRVGGRAPDFELDDHEHKRRIRLSQFHGQKPVLLIFGSFT